MNEPDMTDTRCGFVALIGAPNAGKSTLINQLVGAKISIVTHKVQTTRSTVRGIATHKNAQIILVDTPGLFTPRRRLDQAMVSTAWGHAKDSEVAALLIDAQRGWTDVMDDWVEVLNSLSATKMLILNKIDEVPREKLLGLSQFINEKVAFDQTFMISALKGQGCNALLEAFHAHMPQSPFLFPDDIVSDMPMRMLAADVTREKLFLRLHQELPYATHVETHSWKDNRDGSIRIEQTIFVERDNQKKILIGKSGQTIKAISMAARKEMSELFEAPVHLMLIVKVRDNWGDNPEHYTHMGLEFPKG